MIEKIRKLAEEVSTKDLTVPYDPNQVYSKYERLNPQTKTFIEKFGLDARLFEENPE